MKKYNIHHAKTHLSELVAEAAAGEAFIIAKANRPMVTVVPYTPPTSCPRIGFLKGVITLPDDFDHLAQQEIIAMFEGGVKVEEGKA